MNSASTISLINRFLYESGIRIDCLRLQAIYKKHPMPHSIRIVSDVLDECNVQNIVCRIDVEQLSNVPVPSIVFLKDSEDLFYIFRGLDQNGDIMLETSKRKQICYCQKSFRNIWDGIILMAEADGSEKNTSVISYMIRQILWFISRNILSIMTTLGVCLLLFFLLQSVSDCHTMVTFAVYVLIGLTGAVFSVAAISKNYSDSPLLRQICTIDGYDGCKEVINSEGAIIFGWISLGELSLTYFLSTTLWIMCFPSYAVLLMSLCGGISITAVLYSIFWQIWHRKICALCIVVDTLLVLSFGFSVYEIIYYKVSSDGFVWHFIGFCICFSLTLLIVRIICEIIENRSLVLRYRRRNEKVLAYPNLLWMIMGSVPETIDINEVERMNTISCTLPKTSHRLTVVLSLKCKYCAEFFNIFQKIEGYRKDIILLTDDNEVEDITASIVDIAMKNSTNSWNVACSAIYDWYRLGKRLDTEVPDSARKAVKKQRNFCKRYGITHTPTMFIDGKPLPDIYEAADIQYIL